MDTATYESYLAQWHEKNDSGEGYALGTDTDTPEEAARDAGHEILWRGVEGQIITRTAQGQLVMVCNANGPWAVDLDEEA